jgi:hypothetical protein
MPTIEQTANHLIYSVAPPILCVGFGFLLGKEFKPIRSRSQTHQATAVIETINHFSYSILHATLAGGTGYVVGKLFKCINLSSILGSGHLREFIEKVLAFDQINPYSNFIYCATGCLILPLFCDLHSNPASLVLGITAFTFIPYQVCQRLNHPLTLTGSVLLSALAVCVFWSVRHIEGVLNAPPEKEEKTESLRDRSREIQQLMRIIGRLKQVIESLGGRVEGLDFLEFNTNPRERDKNGSSTVRGLKKVRLSRSGHNLIIGTPSSSSSPQLGSLSEIDASAAGEPDSDTSRSGSHISATSSRDFEAQPHPSINNNQPPIISSLTSPSASSLPPPSEKD